MRNEKIRHWIITGTAPDKYETDIDRKIFHTGTRSAYICSTAEDYELMNMLRSYSSSAQTYIRKEGPSGSLCKGSGSRRLGRAVDAAG